MSGLNSTKKPIGKHYFAIEDIRTKFSEEENVEEFNKTYTKKYPQIINRNTDKLWDEKFSKDDSLKFQDEMTKEKINKIADIIPFKSDRILDLGIGQGYLEERLKNLKIEKELYGIDISPESINRMNQKYNGKFILGDIMDLKKYFKNNIFDVVVAIEVIEHISPIDIFKLLEDVHNLLKDKGSFIISTPLNEGLRTMKDNPSAHVREYTIPTLKMEFKLAGFKVEEIYTHYAFEKHYKLKKVLSKILANRWKPNNVIIKATKI